MNEINVKQIKEINNQCNAYKKKASELLAEKEYKTKTLNEMCARLSEILGVQVTTENLEQIYNERVEKITSTLKVCNDMIERIKLQESGVSVPQGVEHGVGNTQGVGQTVGGMNVQEINSGMTQQVNVIPQSMGVQQGSLAGLPTSDYKIPNEMLDMMPKTQGVSVETGVGVGNSSPIKPTSFANLGGTVNLKQFMQSVPKDTEDVDGI